MNLGISKQQHLYLRTKKILLFHSLTENKEKVNRPVQGPMCSS